MADNLEVNLDINTAPALNSLKNFSSQVQGASKDVKIGVNADTAPAKAKLNEVAAAASQAGSKAGTNFTSSLKEKLKGGDISSSFLGGLIGGGAAGLAANAAGTIVGALKSVIDIGSEFEQNMAGLSAITGVTGKGLDELGDRAKDLAAKFGGDASTQLKSFQGLLSKFGADLAKTPEALGAVSENVNILAKAGGLDAAQAMDTLANSMLQMGVDTSNAAELASESGRFINVLAASAKEGAAEIPQVGEAFLQAGAAVKGANVSFEEANAAIQVLAAGGKLGSEAGVALRNVMGLLQKQSGPGAEALAKMGLSVDQLGQTLTTKGLSSALDLLRGGVNKLGSDFEKNSTIMTLFGTENASAASILLNGADAMEKMTVKITGTNEATKQAETNMATFGEAMSRFKAIASNIAIDVFNGIGKAFSFLSEVLTPALEPLVDNFKKVFGQILAIVKPILAVIGGVIVTNITFAVTTISTILSTVFDVVSRVFDAIKRAVQPLIQTFESMFGTMGEGLDVVELFKTGLNLMVLVITEVGKVVGSLAGFFIELVTTGINFAVAAVNKLISVFGLGNKEMKDTGKAAEDAKNPLEVLKDVFDNIRGTIEGATAALRTIKQIVIDVADAVSKADFGSAFALITGSGDRIKKAYNDGFNSVKKVRQEEEAAAQAAEATAAASEGNVSNYKAIVAAIEKATEAAKKQTAEEVAAAKKLLTQSVDKSELEKTISKEEGKQLDDLIAKIHAKTKAAKKVPTELERQLAIYKDLEKAARKEADAEKSRLKILAKRGQLSESELETKLAEVDQSEVTKLLNATRDVLKVQSDELGLFVSTGINLDKDETNAELQAIQNDLAERAAIEIPVKIIPVTSSFKPSSGLATEIKRQIQLGVLRPIETESKESFDRIAGNLSQTFVDAFGNLNVSELLLPDQESEEVKEKIKDINSEMKSGAIAYQDAVKQIGEQVTETVSFLDKLRTALSLSFVSSAEQALQSSQNAFDEEKRLAEEREAIKTRQFETELQRQNALRENELASNEARKKGFVDLASSAGATMAALLTNMEGAGDSVKKLAVQLASSLVDIFIAPLLASAFAVLGPIAGPIVAGAAVATIKGLLGAAIGSFDEGGATGGRAGEVRGIVHGKEWVARPDVYARNKPLLDALHKGANYRDMMLRPQYSTQQNIAPVASALDRMNNTMSEVRDRLNRVPDMTHRTEGVQLDVGFDSYLFEQDRRRTRIRSMR